MGAHRLISVTLPYGVADLPDLDYEQSADEVYLAHPSYDLHRLNRYSSTDWRLTQVDFTTSIAAPTGLVATPSEPDTTDAHVVAINYVVTAIDPVSDQESLPSTKATCNNDLTLDGNYNTMTWAGQTGVTLYRVYKDGGGGVFGYIGTCLVTAGAGGSFVDQNIEPNTGDNPPQDMSATFAGADDKPGKVSFYQQRLALARTNNKPTTVFTSQSSNFENLNVALVPKADDAMTLTLVARQVNLIQHLVPLGKTLLTLTTDAVFSIAGSNGNALAPTSIDITPQGYRGSSGVRPVTVDEVAFFNTARGANIRSLGYSFDVDGYKGNDLTVFAPHFFRGFKIVDMCWCEYPLSTLFCVRSDGALLAFLWLEEQDVWGWSLIQTAGTVESCCSISEGGEDVLYIIVARVVQGVTRRYIERLSTTLWTDIKNAVYLDASRTYTGDPKSSFGGMDHLEGMTVCAFADGFVEEDLVVTNGRVLLSHAASQVAVGLPYTPTIETLPWVAQFQGGTTQSKRTIIAKAMVMVENTMALRGGVSDDDLLDIKQRDGEPWGEPTAPFTGYLECDAPARWSEMAGVILQGRPGVPFTILGVFPDYDAGG